MRLDMELEFDKYCVVDGSPTTVLPSPRHSSKVEKRKSKGYPRCGNDVLSLNEDLADISFHHYRSASFKSVSSRTVSLEYNEVKKRGSVYQSSKEVMLMRKTDATEGRKKIELSQNGVTALSFAVVDSLCSSDEENSQAEQKRSSVMSLNSQFSTATISNCCVEVQSNGFLDLSFPPIPRSGVSSDGCAEISLDSESGENQCFYNTVRQSVQDSEQVVVPLSGGTSLHVRDPVASLHKSLSAKLAMPHSLARSESDCSRASSPKTRFGPVKKIFDPFVKSKSQRSPLTLSSSIEQQREAPTGIASISRNKTFRKSLLHDFSNTGQHLECEPCSVKDNQLVQSSPAHLQGLLKLDKKNGVPIIEFSVRYPEDVFLARTWKVENALNWIYTFHSAHERRKSSASGRRSKESSKAPSMVGQMQVSCYLCTELKDAGAFDNSMVTEFVLYDTAHPRKSVSSQANSWFVDVAKEPEASDENSLQGSSNVDDVSVKTKVKGQPRHSRHSGHSNSSILHPLAAAELGAHFESAAIVIQVPFEKRESLKFKSGDKKIDQPLLNFLDSSEVEQKKEHIDRSSPAKVNVVIPSGNHSLPATESRGPSPLLDRWRLGGGCDCGGWDMACPLNIFGNPDIQITEDHHLLENKRPLKLFNQGRKDITPALTMTMIEDGQYAVDFHAQLSTLQAFSICVAVLHTTEASVDVKQVQNKQLLQCNSLRVFIEEEVKNLIDAVADEEKHKVNKKVEEVLPSFILNPPFSPIARV